MRILHVLDHSIPVQDGYSQRTLAILRQQRAMGWETCHLTGGKHTPYVAAVEEVAGWEFIRTEPPLGWLANRPVMGQVEIIRGFERQLEILIPKLKPDALHAHSPSLNGVAAINVGRRHGIPVVYEVRSLWEDAAVDHGTSAPGGLRYRATRALETWVLRRAHQVTTICEGLRREVASRGVPNEKITVIPNGVDVELFKQRGEADPRLLKKLGLAGKTVIGFIGSFYAYEGLALLVEAMSHIARTRSDIRAVLVGDGQDWGKTRTMIDALGLGEQVVLTGKVPHAEVPTYYDVMDLLVYPRLSMRLTEMVTPLKPLEAMAREQLVLASDIGGHRELIRNNYTGFLFKPNDARALAEAIEKLVDERGEWARVQQAARRFVETERTWGRCTAPYRAVYSALVKNVP